MKIKRTYISPFCGKGNGEDPGPPSWLRMRLRGADNDAHNHGYNQKTWADLEECRGNPFFLGFSFFNLFEANHFSRGTQCNRHKNVHVLWVWSDVALSRKCLGPPVLFLNFTDRS